MTDLSFDPDDPLLPPVSTDPEEIREEIHARMRELVPGWAPVPTAVLTHAFAAVAQAGAEGRQALVDRIVTVLLELTGTLHGISRDLGQPATSSITVTALDTLGHSEPAGMTVRIGDVELVTTEPLVVLVGETEGTATIAAVENGAAANGATGVPDIEPLDWLASEDPVALDAPLMSGEDPETDAEYALRMIGELAIPRRATRTRDLVFYAQQYPGVGLSWGIAGYDLDTDTDDVPLTATIVVADENGEAFSSPIIAAIKAYLENLTIENFNVFVTNPDYDEIDVTGEIVVREGLDGEALVDEVAARITEIVSPLGHMGTTDGEGIAQTDRVPPAIVHSHTLITEATLVRGVELVPVMDIDDGSSLFHTLSSRIALPTAGTITITEAA